ncbi:hypothetical protein Pfo_004650 [Paulownia fortunei]|nr:hypothetical protein Pfo_004650 [Paulownia fortunei]
MGVHSLGRAFFLLSLLFVVSFCNADEKTFEVVGIGECADCKENNFKTSQAFEGLHVTIDCKLKTGEIKRVGAGELDKEGKFKVSLPQEIVQDGQKLKEECYAQLHSAAAIPCPAHSGLEASKIVFKSQINGKHTFGPTKNLHFSTPLCTSKFLWPYFKYPPLPTTHPWKKKLPKVYFPPLKNFGHPWPLPPLYKPKPLPPPIPIYKPPIVKPLPPPLPIYKPPVVKPLPPPVPIYKPKPKPKPPVVKPLPPPVPIYKPKPPVLKPPKKPLPPPVPVYKPKPEPPVVKPLPPPVPIYKPPVLTKPLPPPIPLYPIPPFKKKPCPPFPKIPPKYFHHPKFGYFPPLPPSIPHP